MVTIVREFGSKKFLLGRILALKYHYRTCYLSLTLLTLVLFGIKMSWKQAVAELGQTQVKLEDVDGVGAGAELGNTTSSTISTPSFD